MKSVRLVTLLLVILALVMGACAAPAAAPAAPAAEAPSREAPAAAAPVAEAPAAPAAKEELQLMGWASSEAENTRLQSVVDGFNASNDSVNVNLSLVPDYDTKLQTSMAGGSPPDVFYIDSFKLPDYVAAGALSPIGDNTVNLDDFYPSLRNAFTVDGIFYCPPKDFSTLALEYNKDMFDAAGVAYPTADWTWDDLRAAAEQLTDAENGVYGMVLNADFARWIAFLYQAGGSVANDDFTAMTINSPEALAAVNFYVGMVTDGFAAQPSDLDSGWNGEAFGKQRAAMAMEGNWIYSYMKDQFPDVNFGLSELPAGPAGKATMAFTVCYGVPADGKDTAASFDVVNYLTGPEGMKAWTDLGLAMPTRQSLRADWLALYPDLEPFLNGAEYAYKWQFRPGFQDVLDTINDGLQQAMAGTMLPEDVLINAEEIGNEVLSR